MKPSPNPQAQGKSLARFIYPLIVAVVLIGGWQGVVTIMELPHYVVPSPGLTVETLFTHWHQLGLALWVTVKITLLAFLLATVMGVLISFLFVQSRVIETAFFPYAILLQVTPIVAVAPLIIIWVRNPTAAMGVTCSRIA